MDKTIWAIKQLEDLLDDRESFLVGKDSDEIYKDDIAALNVAIATLKEKLQYEKSAAVRGYKFCPMCGRRLEVEHERD